MNESGANDTFSYKWIYSARKVHLINFLSNKPTRKVYDLFSIDNLKKVTAKWYGHREKDAVEEEGDKESADSIEDNTVNVTDPDFDVSGSEYLYSSDMENWMFNLKKGLGILYRKIRTLLRG